MITGVKEIAILGWGQCMLARDMKGWNIWTITVVWYKQYVATTVIKDILPMQG
jgi:hypothetical protein